MMLKLTELAGSAKSARMNEKRILRQMLSGVGIGVLGVGTLGGCVNVAAPDEPIVIELNINIRQDVVFALADDAADTVEDNADIF
ncbi:MAG: YnbE family lipoprotein [Erythrobacter sp.]